MNKKPISRSEIRKSPAWLRRVGESRAAREVDEEFERTAKEKLPPLEEIKQHIEEILQVPKEPKHPPNWRDPETGLKESHIRKAGIHVALLGWATMANRQIDSDSQERIGGIVEEMMEDIKNTKELRPISDEQVERAVNLGNLVINLIDGENDKVEKLLAGIESSIHR